MESATHKVASSIQNAEEAMPEMHYVDSTNIEAIGYDEAQHELHVRFLKSGDTYVYSNVEAWVWDEFLRADSKGKYFGQHIKNSYSGLNLESIARQGIDNDWSSLPSLCPCF